MNKLVLGRGLVSLCFELRECCPSEINPESRPFLFYDGEAPLHLRLFLRSLLQQDSLLRHGALKAVNSSGRLLQEDSCSLEAFLGLVYVSCQGLSSLARRHSIFQELVQFCLYPINIGP